MRSCAVIGGREVSKGATNTRLGCTGEGLAAWHEEDARASVALVPLAARAQHVAGGLTRICSCRAPRHLSRRTILLVA